MAIEVNNVTAIAWAKSWHLLSGDMVHTVCNRIIPFYADCRKWHPIMNTCISCAKKFNDAVYNANLHRYYAPVSADYLNPLFDILTERTGNDEIACLHVTLVTETDDDCDIRYTAGICGNNGAVLITKEGRIIPLDSELENIE